MRRRSMVTAVLGMAILAGTALTGAGPIGAGTAAAAESAPFADAAFAAAQKAGRAIVVAVHAEWCPMCSRQKEVMGRFLNDAAFKDVVVFSVDYDAQKDVARRFNVRSQGTLIAFRGADERERVVGVTDEAALRELVAKAAR